MKKTGELTELLEADRSIYHHGYSAGELRKILNKRIWPEFIDKAGLRRLCEAVLELAEKGLKERGYEEEHYLMGLKARAESLSSPALDMVKAMEAGEKKEDWIRKYAALTA